MRYISIFTTDTGAIRTISIFEIKSMTIGGHNSRLLSLLYKLGRYRFEFNLAHSVLCQIGFLPGHLCRICCYGGKNVPFACWYLYKPYGLND